MKLPDTMRGRMAFLGGNLSYGITDDPTDEFIEYALALIPRDLAAVGTVVAISESAVWRALDNWRSIGTDAGPINTMTVEDLDGDSDSEYANASIDDGQVWALLAASSVASAIQISGSLNWRETIFQRTFAGNERADMESDEMWQESGFVS